MDALLSVNGSALHSLFFDPGAHIEGWLVERIAALSQLSSDDVDVTLPFSYYALDSLGTVGLTAELEDWLGLALPPTLVWDYPTISTLASHLAELRAH